MKRISLLALVLALLGIAVYVAQAAVMGGTDAELRAVIDYSFGDNVTIAALSPDFPLNFELPIPENTQILASMVYEHQNETGEAPNQAMRILLRSNNISPSTIGEHYRDYFSENAWQELQFDFNRATGFDVNDTVSGAYCYQRDYKFNYSLWANSLEENGQLDWDITISSNPTDAECQVFAEGYKQLADFFPQFEPVEGAELLEYIGLNTIHLPQVSVTGVTGLQLSIPLGDVFAAYNEQLSAYGWTEAGIQLEANFAISDWHIHTDEMGDLTGRLVILQKTANSNEYTAYISLEQ